MKFLKPNVSLGNVIKDITELVEYYKERATEAEKKNAEWNRDCEIEKRDKIIKKLQGGWHLDDIQKTEARKWIEKHKEKFHQPLDDPKGMLYKAGPSCRNGRPSFEYSVAPTYVGSLCSIECKTCLKHFYLKDFETEIDLDNMSKDEQVEIYSHYLGEI